MVNSKIEKPVDFLPKPDSSVVVEETMFSVLILADEVSLGNEASVLLLLFRQCKFKIRYFWF